MQPPNTKTLARDILRSLAFGKMASHPPGRPSTVISSQTTPSASTQPLASYMPVPSGSAPPAPIAPTHSQLAASLPLSGPLPRGATVILPDVALLRPDRTAAAMGQTTTGQGPGYTEAPVDESSTAAQPDIDMQPVLTGPSSSSPRRDDSVGEPARNSPPHSQSSRPPSGAVFMDLVTPDPSPPLGTHPLDDISARPGAASSTSQQSDNPGSAFLPKSQQELHGGTSYVTGLPGPEAAFGYISPRNSPPLAARITEVDEDEEVAGDQSATGADVDMDASSPAPQPSSSSVPSASPSVSTGSRKRNRAYVNLPPLPAHLRAAHRRMLKRARLEETEPPSPQELARAAAEKARQEGASASR